MRRHLMTMAAGATVLVSGCASTLPAAPTREPSNEPLPAAATDGERSLEEVLAGRRSIREFAGRPLAPELVAQLLWSAQGVTSDDGRRTAPSAGALYPLELYVVDADGAHRYEPDAHATTLVMAGDVAGRLAEAVGQDPVPTAPVLFVITGVEARTAERYGERAERYVWLEAGHAAQNLLLQATALGLGAVPLGSFDDDAVRSALGLPDGETPLYVIPVGHPAS